MAKRDGIIVGLDIGTTKICCIVGEITGAGLDVIGIGTAPSKGLKKGVVINIESTVSAIKRAVEEAELMAGVDIAEVYAGISGGHIRGFNSHNIDLPLIKASEVTRVRACSASSTRRARWRFRSTEKSSTCCRKSSWSTIKTGSKSRSA